jgi:hypothetical protein
VSHLVTSDEGTLQRPSLWLLFPCARRRREAVPPPRLEATSPGRASHPRGASARLPSSTHTRSRERTRRPSLVVATLAAPPRYFASVAASCHPPTRARPFLSRVVQLSARTHPGAPKRARVSTRSHRHGHPSHAVVVRAALNFNVDAAVPDTQAGLHLSPGRGETDGGCLVRRIVGGGGHGPLRRRQDPARLSFLRGFPSNTWRSNPR